MTQPIKERPLPDPRAFAPDADKLPKRPERVVLDKDGKEIEPPNQKVEYQKAQDRRRQ